MASILDVHSNIPVEGGSIGFIGKGNVIIEDTYKRDTVELSRNLLFKAIDNTAFGQLDIIAYDSDLTGIFAPFTKLASGEQRIMKILSNEDELHEQFDQLHLQIQAVNNLLAGRYGSLYDFRRETESLCESYYLVALAMDIGRLSDRDRGELSLLMRKGPACGVSFLIISPIISPEVETFLFLVQETTTVLKLAAERNTFLFEMPSGKSGKGRYKSISATTVINTCAQGFPKQNDRADGQGPEKSNQVEIPVVEFASLHPHESISAWNEESAGDWLTNSSAHGLTFCVGKYGDEDVEITLGDNLNQRHNVLVTGAVGQGKSNLLMAIIHSLCLKYSPNELELYLLDFKEGVTFKPFAAINRDEYLPHVKAIGLESDVTFGRAVLEHLNEEYLRRMKLFKNEDVPDIQKFRERHKDTRLPRIVAIIDEFQMLFGDDPEQAQAVASQLEKSVRLFRAAGIHFILSSQTLGGNTALAQKRESLFAQVPIRIALKNSRAESMQTLQIGNTQAANLKARQAIVNLDYGELAQNKKTMIAFADEKILKGLRYKWWKYWTNNHHESRAPLVFNSEERLTVFGALESLSGKASVRAPHALFGKAIAISESFLSVPLPNEPGRNISIIGNSEPDCDTANGMIQAIALSLALQLGGNNARYIFCNLLNRDIDYASENPRFAAEMLKHGAQCECINADDLTSTLEGLLESGADGKKVFLFATGMDNYPAPQSLRSNPLSTFVNDGPLQGMHFIGWWMKGGAFSKQFSGLSGSEAFNTKILLRVDSRTVQSLIGPSARWTPQNNRAFVSNSIDLMSDCPFVPFAPVEYMNNKTNTEESEAPNVDAN